jgi:hypothetical protein
MSSFLLTALILCACFACLYGASEWAARRMHNVPPGRQDAVQDRQPNSH